MRRTLTLTFATTLAIGILALAVGAVTVTSNMQIAQAEKDCTPYGALVSHEARTDSGRPEDTRNGFGDEVTAANAEANPNFGQDFRQPGQRPSGSSTCGNS